MERDEDAAAESPAWMQSICLILLAVGAVIILLPRPSGDARAEIREQAAPQAFLSGAARSETTLREIADTLKRIDTRLERLERAVYTAQEEKEQPAAQDGEKSPSEASPAGDQKE
jgi:hypothetical protein